MRSGGGVRDDLRMGHARHREAERDVDAAIQKGRAAALEQTRRVSLREFRQFGFLFILSRVAECYDDGHF